MGYWPKMELFIIRVMVLAYVALFFEFYTVMTILVVIFSALTLFWYVMFHFYANNSQLVVLLIINMLILFTNY